MSDQQAEFGADLCKLFVTCGWSWNAANNPEFKLFFDKYLPSAVIPDHRVLSGSILTSEANKVISATRQKIEGKLATYSEDGWKNVVHTHVDTSVLSVEGQPYLLRTHDMTGRPKTGDELFEIMKSDFEYAWNTYRVEIIAVCTDDGPDGKKARRLIVEWKKSIAAFYCWAHQSSLMTGNYLSIKAPWMKDAKEGLVVVKWFNNHRKALDLLCAQRMATFAETRQLLLPVVTRWTIHYCCLRRIRKLERAFRICVVNHEEVLRLCAGKKPEQIAAAEHVIDTCKRNSFWKNINRITHHLEPLAIAANILQSPHCRLDTVLLTLANLFRIFNNVSLEDAILMILGVFFNPYIRAHSFKRDALSGNSMFHMVRYAYERLLGQTALGDIEFFDAFRAYYDRAGDFSEESMWLDGYAASYRAAKKPVDLVSIWRQLEGTRLTGQSGFIKLAIRVLSILPNSAGPECAFSVFGLTHTKHRNRLDPQVVHDSTTVRMDRQKAHVAAGLVQPRKARRFSLADDDAGDGGDENTVDPSDFDTMADALIGLTQNEPNEDDDDEPDLPPITPLLASSASQTITDPGSARVPAYKKIKLANMFNYPTAESPAPDFEFFGRVVEMVLTQRRRR
ncbi:ribonuclease H-like domain-containing protein [Mycena maculata]|uniref:Ribonuclease H-like domain-containing protein n=1 Tax=Mycena maculata TaxID=230809 RepID=A0AAD7N790_9AGAR|nr:ribonuclease H-like domain-containing protein [Mycena maculata]